MPWRRGRIDEGPDLIAMLTERLSALEMRVEYVEDTAAMALAPDRVDHLAQRLEELSLTMATHDDVLETQVHAARVSAEVARVAAELRAEIDHVRATAAAAVSRSTIQDDGRPASHDGRDEEGQRMPTVAPPAETAPFSVIDLRPSLAEDAGDEPGWYGSAEA